MTRVRVLSPVGVATRDTVSVPPLPESLAGRTELKLGGMWGIQDWPRWMHAVTDDDALLPQVPSPEDVIVMVAGGPGKHSAVVPNCTCSRAVSRPIQPI
jgi:hypothetical protein